MGFNLTFDKAKCSYCIDPDSCVKVCIIWIDILLGIVHLFVGLVGLLASAVALYLFYNIGQKKPYYTAIAFEILSDFIVSGIALYSAAFLLSGRDSMFDKTFVCELSGMLWNWNMVITPLLLSVAGLIRVQAIFWPHNSFLNRNKLIVTGVCVFCYLYGAVSAIFPYFYDNAGYRFYNEYSMCDYWFDAEERTDMADFYLAIMGPLPMVLSLLCIVSTNAVIVVYLVKRYKGSWTAVKRVSVNTNETTQEDTGNSYGHFMTHVDDKVKSKHVVISLLIMTGWYMLCYSIIIFTNFKKLYSAWNKKETSLGLEFKDTIGMTYFFAVYNFLAFLNSFVNPFILLMTGNIFRRELAKVSTRLRKKYTWFRITSNKSAGAARNNVNNKCNRKCSLQVPLPVTHINSSGVASDNSFVKAESYG